MKVEPKVMRVLLCLAQCPGEALTRAQLHEAAWPDTVVSDKVLTRAISELRKVFEDDPHAPRVIATISKMGYRLIAPVDEAQARNGQPVATSDGRPLPVPVSSARQRFVLYAFGALLVAFIAGGAAWALLTATPHTPALTPAVPLTTAPGHELDPMLSPNGQDVVYVWQVPEEGQWDLYLKRVGSETPLRLTDHPGDDVRPLWSPEGTHLIFQRYTDDACLLLMIPALGGPERKLNDCYWYPSTNRAIWAPKLSWSPDGKRLARPSRTSGDDPLSIYLMSLETLERHPLTAPPEGSWGDADPVFSPDGQWVSFLRYTTSAFAELHVISLETKEEHQLTSAHRMILGHDWTPDSKHIIYSSNQGSTFSLWKLPVSGGTPVWVPATGWNLKEPSLAREGGRMVYENWLYDTNIWRAPVQVGATSETAAPLITSTLWDVHPQYAPDGRRIAFVSNRSGSYELWTSAADGSDLVQVTALGGAVVGGPRWSPNGRKLAFHARPEGYADVYVVDAEGGTARRITANRANDAMPAWSPDGEGLYFSSDRSGVWQIWKTAADGGKAVQLTHQGGYAPQVAGAYVYYAKVAQPGLWRSPVDGGSETLVLDVLAEGDWGNWAVMDDGVYFVKRAPRGPATLSFYSYETRRERPVMTLLQSLQLHQPGFSLSPDRRWLLFQQLDQTQSDLMLLDDAPF